VKRAFLIPSVRLQFGQKWRILRQLSIKNGTREQLHGIKQMKPNTKQTLKIIQDITFGVFCIPEIT
jgi:hypothetical protein